SGYQSLTNNLALIFRPFQHIRLKGDVAVSKTNNRSDDFIDPASGRYSIHAGTDFSTIGELNIRQTEAFSLNTNFVANYDAAIQEHYVNFSLGINTRETITQGNAM